MTGRKRLIDIGHTVSHEMLTHPWMPKPLVNEYITREQSASFLSPGVTFALSQISLPGNTGTYLDAPFQFHVDMSDVARLPLERLVDVPVVVIRIDTASLPGGREIGPEIFEGRDLTDKAVLLHTGHSRSWGTGAFFQDSPYLTADAAKLLVDIHPGIFGADTQNIDSGTDQSKPAQNLLLGADIYLLECVSRRIEEVPETGALLTVVPTPVEGMGSFPVRPFVTVTD
ncbi:cyclase family protein [Nonomuraea sp. NPDC049158]|uniref:cyclase family protein n=1 Tax=Nonomuraea sp. NPDC049158 TaxID=3155649 RepID=UPI00340D720B